MLQDYIQLSEGKKAHGHTHNDNMLTSILPSSSHHQGGRVRCGQIGAHRPSSQNNTYSALLLVLMVVCRIYLLALRRPMHVGAKHVGIMVDEVKGQCQEHTAVCVVHGYQCLLEH